MKRHTKSHHPAVKVPDEVLGGLDGVTADMLRAEEVDTPVYLHSILQNIWNDMILPTEWTTGLIIKLPKKGDLDR